MEYISGTSTYFVMVALAGWWNTPTFSPIGVLSAFYDTLPVIVSRNSANTFFTFGFARLLMMPQSNDILSLGLTILSAVDGGSPRQR